MHAAALDQLLLRDLPAASGGDREAYGRIVAACQNAITAIALAITRDVQASEDIAQEAFLSAWQNLRRLNNPASFLPWLRQITRNLAHDHLRARRHEAAPADEAEAAIAAAADPAPTPMQRLLDDERQQAAAELISALPDESREVLLLYYREGRSSQQVALLLGLSDAAVRKRLSRARQAVRAELLQRFGEFARSTAPGFAFTSAVTTTLVVASPPAAAAGILSSAAGVAGTAAAKSFGKLLLGSAGSAGLALVAAFAGIWLGLRRQLRGALDERERMGLVRSAVINALASVGFVAVLLAVAYGTEGWIAPVLATLAFMAVVFWQSLVVQPRVLARRHALEAQRDPAAAARRRRRERIQCWIGAIVGLVCGLGGLIVGLVSSGRI